MPGGAAIRARAAARVSAAAWPVCNGRAFAAPAWIERCNHGDDMSKTFPVRGARDAGPDYPRVTRPSHASGNALQAGRARSPNRSRTCPPCPLIRPRRCSRPAERSTASGRRSRPRPASPSGGCGPGRPPRSGERGACPARLLALAGRRMPHGGTGAAAQPLRQSGDRFRVPAAEPRRGAARRGGRRPLPRSLDPGADRPRGLRRARRVARRPLRRERPARRSMSACPAGSGRRSTFSGPARRGRRSTP